MMVAVTEKCFYNKIAEYPKELSIYFTINDVIYIDVENGDAVACKIVMYGVEKKYYWIEKEEKAELEDSFID